MDTNDNITLKDSLSKKLTMLDFIIDLPNLCTLCALFSSVIGIYFAVQGIIYYAVIGLLWAVLFDWLDGLIAKKMKNRSAAHSAFGVQLDSLVDVVSFGVLPAVILITYTNYSISFLPVAFIVIAACIIRLGYFNIYGLSDTKKYTGLPADHNGLLFSLAFLFETVYSGSYFSIILVFVLLVIAGLNISSLQIPKLSKKWIWVIGLYVILMSVYLVQLS